VPSLKFLNWSILEIGRGSAVTRLPLNVESSNQYITQQAALQVVAADYTGGIALGTLFRSTPIIGFHPMRTDYGAYLWGAAATVRWLRPSTADLICKCSIPEKDWDQIATTFDEGEDVNYKARIRMYSDDGRIAAISDFQYWARNSHSLRATGRDLDNTHHMLLHKLRTSARLIAGLRSWINSEGRVLDPFAAQPAADGPEAIAKTMERLKIQVPLDAIEQYAVRKPPEELSRERCDQQAIVYLGKALDITGYRREAANAHESFSDSCGGQPSSLRAAVNILLKLSDHRGAVRISLKLIQLEPFNDNGYYLRALGYDQGAVPNPTASNMYSAFLG